MIQKTPSLLAHAARFVYLAFGALGACSAASAEPASTSQSALVTSGGAAPSFPAQNGPPHAPPQEAIDACKSAAEGAACSVTFDGHTIDGTCHAPPDDSGPLACLPAHPPGQPPEAVEACTGASEGSACQISLETHDINGTCHAPPDGNGPLACMPQGAPPPAR